MKATTSTHSNGSVSLNIEYDNGDSQTFDTQSLPPNVIAQLLAYGLKQKLVDALAPRKDKGWSDEDCQDRLTGLWESMENGSFTVKAPGSSLAAKVNDMQEKLNKFLAMSPEQKATLEAIGITESDFRRNLAKAETALKKSLAKKSNSND